MVSSLAFFSASCYKKQYLTTKSRCGANFVGAHEERTRTYVHLRHLLGEDTKRAHEGRMRTYVHLHREQRRRASGFDARNRGTQGVPQAVRAKRVRPFHIKRIRICGTYTNRLKTPLDLSWQLMKCIPRFSILKKKPSWTACNFSTKQSGLDRIKQRGNLDGQSKQ